MSRLEKQVSSNAKLSSKTVKSPVLHSRQNRTDEEFSRELSRNMQRDQLIESIKKSKSKSE